MEKGLEVKQVYEKLKEQIKREVSALGQLTLASVRIGHDYSSGVYLSQQEKIALELGIDYLAVTLTPEAPLDKVLQKIEELNKDNNVTGIVLNKPFPVEWKEGVIFSAIDSQKDVEGVNPYNLGMLLIGKPKFISPTVMSVLEFLNIADIDLYAREVTIVGSSVLIGKPLAIILANNFATVSITHIATYEKGRLPFYVNNADILISAVGKPYFIRGEWIKEGAVVIDVGVGQKDGKLTGDVEFDEAAQRASFITPVPGGVGKFTTLFLFENLIKAKQSLPTLPRR